MSTVNSQQSTVNSQQSTVNSQQNDKCTTADDLRATAELRIGYKIDIYSIALLASYPTQQRDRH